MGLLQRQDRYRIGNEEIAGVIFAFIYLALGFVFGEPNVSFILFGLFVLTILIGRLGIEWPLAIYVRTVHIMFIALVALIKMSVIKI
jgi:ABC-type multidrug transport system permease subunit